MGANIAAGELLQLYVPGGWWKASEIPAEDLEKASAEDAKDRVGCLISEVVCPGWTIDQHKFLTKEKVSDAAVWIGTGFSELTSTIIQLLDMWHGAPGWEEFQKYIRGE
jgi:hypothetical protein